MRKHKDNPPDNILPISTTDDAIVEAIKISGYPLQTVVASQLLADFGGVTEEWGYIDRDTGEHRSLDVFAYKQLCDDRKAIRPVLALLIECKQSRHPYVFFQSVNAQPIPAFPFVAGMHDDGIVIEELSKTRRSRRVTGAEAFSLNLLPFVLEGPPRCAAFTRIRLDGKRAEPSGSEIFKDLVLPIIKAQDHASFMYRNRGNRANCIWPMLLLNLAVVDAPVVLVEHPSKVSDPILSPWARVIRHEAHISGRGVVTRRDYVIDVIHHSAFRRYIDEYVMPLSSVFAERALASDWLREGTGIVDDLDSWTWDTIRTKG